MTTLTILNAGIPGAGHSRVHLDAHPTGSSAPNLQSQQSLAETSPSRSESRRNFGLGPQPSALRAIPADRRREERAGMES